MGVGGIKGEKVPTLPVSQRDHETQHKNVWESAFSTVKCYPVSYHCGDYDMVSKPPVSMGTSTPKKH